MNKNLKIFLEFYEHHISTHPKIIWISEKYVLFDNWGDTDTKLIFNMEENFYHAPYIFDTPDVDCYFYANGYYQYDNNDVTHKEFNRAWCNILNNRL